MTACCEAELSFPLRRTAPQSTTEPQDTVAGKRFHEHRNHALQPGMVVRHDWALLPVWSHELGRAFFFAPEDAQKKNSKTKAKRRPLAPRGTQPVAATRAGLKHVGGRALPRR